MKFSKDSELIMESMMDHFEKFIKNKNGTKQREFDRIMKKFYTEIKLADKFVEKEWKTQKVKVSIKEVPDFKSINHTSLLSSTYIPEKIKSYIKNNIKGIINYKCSIGGRDITIGFYLMNNGEFNQLNKFDKLAFKMLTWLKFITVYTRARCNKTLKIYCYTTPLKKVLPTSPFVVLAPDHANTAVTTTCAVNGEICMFRKEEIFKVFIHETFHSLGLDFSSMSTTLLNQKIKTLFPITSDFNLYEGYTEFWATIMNCTFTAYYMSNDDLKEFYLYAEYCIAFEQFFSLFQCVKVLDFMGLHYKNLHDKTNLSGSARKYLYKEKTNIFAYYIIKTILLYNAIPFIKWCKTNNDNTIAFYRSKDNQMHFYRFIKARYNDKTFNKELNEMQNILKKYKSRVADGNDKILAKTMRMTVVEFM